MTVSEILRKMVDFSEGNLHDINHFVKVHAYAEEIGQLEKLDEETQFILEVAAITHDIACPLCRRKYGNCDGHYQETEGSPLVREFLADTGLSDSQIDRVSFLVGHHHTITGVDGLDWRILLEADFLVNADEMNIAREQIISFRDKVFRTASGLYLINSMYSLS